MRDHNEDSHFLDEDLGVFLVCDGMGGHAAGEVASDLAIRAIRQEWGGAALHQVAEQWLERGTPEAKKQLLDVVRAGVIAAHDSILAEADRDETKSGMGTTLVGAVIVGGELVFAHAGDSRAYLVRDGISMQLTEDHTLLARLLAAGIDVDVSGEGSRFRSMLTNALGIGDEVKVSTFVVPLADGDRFLLCSDGVSEYVPENEVGDVLTKQSSPARAAQRLIDLALERGGGDNATAVVVRVLEAGETPLPAEQRKKDDAAINACALWGKRVTPQQRLRALRIAIPRDHSFGEKLPPHALGDRVAWMILEGELVQDGETFGPGSLIYPESLASGREPLPPPGRDALAITRSDVRALAIRANDFRELCDDDGELGEALLDSLATMIGRRRPRPARDTVPSIDPRGNTDPQLPAVPREISDADPPTDPRIPVVDEPPGLDAWGGADGWDDRAAAVRREQRDRAATVPDEPSRPTPVPRSRSGESSIIAPAPPRTAAAQPPSRPSPPQITRRAVPPPPPQPPSRPSPPPGQLARAQTRPSQPPPPLGSPGPAPAPADDAEVQPPRRPSAPPDQLVRPNRPSPPPPPGSSQAAAQPPARPSPPPPPGSSQAAARAPARPSPPPPPGSSQAAAQPPSRPSPPPLAPAEEPPGALAEQPASRPVPTAAQAQAAATLAQRTTPTLGVPRTTPARGIAHTTPVRGVPRAATPAPSTTPVRGVAHTTPARGVPRTTPARGIAHTTPARGVPRAAAPVPRSEPARSAPPSTPPQPREPAPPARPSSPPRAATPRPQAWVVAPAPQARAESPWDASSEADTERGRPITQPPPKGFARALTPPPGARVRRASGPQPGRGDGAEIRTPTDPEIETYLELEADLPGPDVDPDLESELALSFALSGDLDDHESVSITIEEEGRRVTETTTETSAHTLTVTVTEPVGHDDRRAITAEDGLEVSGTISIPEDTPPPRRRPKRQSEGWDE